MYFSKLKVKKLNIKSERGFIDLVNLDYSEDSVVAIDYGEVSIDSANDFKLKWTNKHENICLSAPSISNVITHTGCNMTLNV